MPLTLKEWEYLAIDWTQTDAAISRQMRLTRARVQQVRKLLGHKPSEGNISPDTRVMVAWMKANPSLSGLVTVDELAATTGAPAHLAYHAAKRIGFKLAKKHQGPPPDPRYALINFDLPNRDLVTIWRFADPPSQKLGFRMGQYRYRLGIGPSFWDGRTVYKDDPAYQTAIEAEKAKANTYFEESK